MIPVFRNENQIYLYSSDKNDFITNRDILPGENFEHIPFASDINPIYSVEFEGWWSNDSQNQKVYIFLETKRNYCVYKNNRLLFLSKKQYKEKENTRNYTIGNFKILDEL